MSEASLARLQYMACIVLGYSVAEYNSMYPCDIVDQLDVHLQINGQNTSHQNQDEDGVTF